MKEINLTYFESKGRIYIPFDDHLELIKDLQNEKERLKTIIKEAREYIEEHNYPELNEMDYYSTSDLLEILDKENNNV